MTKADVNIDKIKKQYGLGRNSSKSSLRDDKKPQTAFTAKKDFSFGQTRLQKKNAKSFMTLDEPQS